MTVDGMNQGISMGELYRQVLEHGIPDPSPVQKAAAFRRFLARLEGEDIERARTPAPLAAARPAAQVWVDDCGEGPITEVIFLTVAEVVLILRVSKMTVYRLIHSSDLPAIRVGRSFRVPEQAVYDYLQDGFVHVEQRPSGESEQR